MFTFKVKGIQFDAKVTESKVIRDKYDRADRKKWREERARKYKSGNAAGYEIVCSDGSFKIDKWCLQSCEELGLLGADQGRYPLVESFEGMVLRTLRYRSFAFI